MEKGVSTMKGIVFGCFIPLHAGHMSMIKYAADSCKDLIIVVCGHKGDRGDEFIPFEDRRELMEEFAAHHLKSHSVKIVTVDDGKIHPDGNFLKTDWEGWCRELFRQIPPEECYTWFTGEQDYIDAIRKSRPADAFVKMDRSIIPVSGTNIRRDMEKNRKYIEDNYYRYLRDRKRQSAEDAENKI